MAERQTAPRNAGGTFCDFGLPEHQLVEAVLRNLEVDLVIDLVYREHAGEALRGLRDDVVIGARLARLGWPGRRLGFLRHLLAFLVLGRLLLLLSFKRRQNRQRGKHEKRGYHQKAFVHEYTYKTIMDANIAEISVLARIAATS